MSIFAELAKGVGGTILKTVAPALGTAVAGPFGGIAAAWIAKKVLGKESADPKEIIELLNNIKDPETMEKLRIADREFEAEMKRQGIDIFKIEVDDRKSARELTGKSNIAATMQGALGSVIICGFFYTVWMVLAGSIDIADANKALLVGTVVGYVSAKADQVTAFLFGSTHGSQQKSEQMATVLKNHMSGGK